MTARRPLAGFTARQLLDYCRHGSRKMRDDPMGPDWVLAWGGTIALLRAIGHALARVDPAADPALAAAQKKWWRDLNASKPDPLIFWKFIERDLTTFIYFIVPLQLSYPYSPAFNYLLDAGHPGVFRVH